MAKKRCFVIGPIGDAGSEIRNRSDLFFEYIVKPTMEKLGYEPIRADHIADPGLITTQVIQSVIDSEMVIADLTGRNPNVFYELAVRHATQKPLVQLIKKGEVIPFDVAGMRTIQVDLQDLRSVDEAKTEVQRQVHALEKNGKVETPISVSLDLKSLRESGNPEQRSLADLLQAIGEVKQSVATMDGKLSGVLERGADMALGSVWPDRTTPLWHAGQGSYLPAMLAARVRLDELGAKIGELEAIPPPLPHESQTVLDALRAEFDEVARQCYTPWREADTIRKAITGRARRPGR